MEMDCNTSYGTDLSSCTAQAAFKEPGNMSGYIEKVRYVC